MAEIPQACYHCRNSGAKCLCFCTSPPLPLCLACILLHISAPGSHLIHPLPQSLPAPSTPSRPPPENECCSECHTSLAEVVCCCTQIQLSLCKLCFDQHSAKHGKITHSAVPIYARKFVSSPGYFERLTKRHRKCEAGLREAQTNFEVVNKCREAITKKHEKVTKMMDKYRKNTFKELDEYQLQLEKRVIAAKEEIESHIFEDDYAPQSPIAQELWNFEPGKLKLFAYRHQNFFRMEIAKKLSPLDPSSIEFAPTPSPKPFKPPKKSVPSLSFSKVELDIEQAVASQAAAPFESDLRSHLFFLTNTYLSYRNMVTLTPVVAVSFPHPIQVSALTSGIELPNRTLLVCGKKSPKDPTTLEIAIETGRVAEVGDMLQWKYAHGLALVHNIVFAFGGSGIGGMLNTTEAYNLETRVWTKRANMHTARDRFNPCVHSESVYLFGGRKTPACEVYDPRFDAYSMLDVIVPKGGQTMAVGISDERILIIGQMYQWIWDVRERKMVEMRVKELKGGVWGNMNPLVVGGNLYVPKFAFTSGRRISISEIISQVK